MISDSSVNNLLSLNIKFKVLTGSIINYNFRYSLINIKDETLNELQNFSTLKSEGGTGKGFNEILNSQVFRNFVIRRWKNIRNNCLYRKIEPIFKNKKEKIFIEIRLKKKITNIY